MKLDSPINSIPKIGPRYKELLKKLEISTVGDLLYHFPFRYDDFSKIAKIADTNENEAVTVKATLIKIDNIFTKYGKRITTGRVEDETGKLNLIWFNQHYIKQSLNVGQEYEWSGTIKLFSGKKSLLAPQFEEADRQSLNIGLNTGRLVPIYEETAGVSSKWLRSRINDVLSVVKTSAAADEFIPENILKKHSLENFIEALKNFHFPENQEIAQKSKNRFIFEELLMELLRVENRKDTWNKKFENTGISLELKQDLIKNFVNTLPFTLTQSQTHAYKEILGDMTKEKPMNRLLEGDVGTGKTVVAIIASYASFLNGYKTLYMAPTEILANQHYETFKKLLLPYKISVELKTGSTKIAGNKNTDGKDFDILIGTHALLFGNMPKTTALIIIDEQHRFGVEQRAKILEIAINGYEKTSAARQEAKRYVPHLLTMTATPIPRTLALTIYGDLDISVLKDTPNINKKITTRVVPETKRQQTYEWIKNKNEQAFIVCPLIEESEHESLENVKSAEVEFKKLNEGVFKDISIALLHGRMKPKDKQEILENFRNGNIQILVSTPVIEVGVDIPNAVVMVIESAERYGLASLHQLRGRVGRGDKEGFCLLFMSNSSRSSYTRLKYMENTNSGMELAEIDMKIRGQGDVYGIMQHGFKRFKVASFSDTDWLEKAKLEAKEIFPRLDLYPKLKKKLGEINAKLVGNN